jgi:hypothetical protein
MPELEARWKIRPIVVPERHPQWSSSSAMSASFVGLGDGWGGKAAKPEGRRKPEPRAEITGRRDEAPSAMFARNIAFVLPSNATGRGSRS